MYNTYSMLPMGALAIWGWIENDTAAHAKLLSAAKYFATHPGEYDPDTNPGGIWLLSGTNSLRAQIIAITLAYDFLRTGVITFSDADKKIVGDALLSVSNLTYSDQEFLDGHSQAHMMCKMLAASVLLGEYGTGFDYRVTAATRFEHAAGFWFGDTPGDASHIETVRHMCGQGGSHMGPWYSQIRLWASFWTMLMMHNAFVRNVDTPHALQLDGGDWAPMTDETWIQAVGEYPLTLQIRGDHEYYQMGEDTARSSPCYHTYLRFMNCFLATWGGDWRKQNMWMRNYQHDWEEVTETGGVTDSVLGYDVCLCDPADSSNTATHPKDMVPALDKTFYANPPGTYAYRNTWDYTNAGVVLVNCHERFQIGHQHLCAGGITMSVKDDMVLLATGNYDTPNSKHYRYWYQQSLAHSGVPLIHDGQAVAQGMWILTDGPGSSTPYVNYSSQLGGQLYKRMIKPGPFEDRDPDNMTQLLTDGSGIGWKRSTFAMPESTSDYDFLTCDLRHAYLREYVHLNTTTERVTKCVVRLLVIKGESTWPIVFRVVEIDKRLPSFTVRDQWHSHNNFSITYPHPWKDGDPSTYGDTQRLSSTGYRGTGKIVIDYYNWWEFSPQIFGDSLPLYGNRQMWDLEINRRPYDWSPTTVHGSRHNPDVGRYTVYMIGAIQRTKEYLVNLLMPMGVNDAPVEYQWIDEANWFGVQFSATNHSYRINKTADTVQVSAGGEDPGPDSTPPGKPTILTATPASEAATVTWQPNSETDMASYKVYYREKV